MGQLSHTIYLADLTHTGTVISSNVFPLGIGLIGANLQQNLADQVDVELFKFPEDLSVSLDKKNPRLVGFANYSWNLRLSYEFIKRIKKKHPNVVIICGGPNYELSDEGVHKFWETYPLIDFYIVREGEIATQQLVEHLIEFDFDAAALKASGKDLAGCHYLYKNELVQHDLPARVRNLEDLPSPYLMGLMDKFFDAALTPLIHTTRGCPFQCKFCTEGARYYSKVSQRYELIDELTYIAERIQNVSELYLSDANFGMFKGDTQKAKLIAQVQQKYDWPRRVHVSTGKNQKERVIEVASILQGSLSVAASLQSTDPELLDNVNRKNISIDALSEMAAQAEGVDAGTYTELILGLPGDTVEKHTQSLRDTVNANLGLIRMYQLILLPQTELNTEEQRNTFGMQTQYRVMPRSFGGYSLYGESFVAVEYEEICIANNTMSFEDYIHCREMDLTIEILQNGNTFLELQGFCKWVGYDWFELMTDFNKTRRESSPGIKNLFDTFRQEFLAGLWKNPEALCETVEGDLSKYLEKDNGTNEMSNAKATAFFFVYEEVLAALVKNLKVGLQRRDQLTDLLDRYLDELSDFILLRREDLLESGAPKRRIFQFHFDALMAEKFNVDPAEYEASEPVVMDFWHSNRQLEMIRSYVHLYGDSHDGLGRICMRAPMNKLYRQVTVEGVAQDIDYVVNRPTTVSLD